MKWTISYNFQENSSKKRDNKGQKNGKTNKQTESNLSLKLTQMVMPQCEASGLRTMDMDDQSDKQTETTTDKRNNSKKKGNSF